MNISRKQSITVAVAVTTMAAILLISRAHPFFGQTTESTLPNTITNGRGEQGAPIAWSTHTNTEGAFQVNYPSDLPIITIPPADAPPRNAPDQLLPQVNVSFGPPNRPGFMGVKIYRAVPFSSLEDWLQYENRNRESQRKEKMIRIDGRDAMVTYEVSVGPGVEEEFLREKKTAILKDGDLYEIWTRFYNNPEAYEIVWESFRFTQ